jgi:hypothetical protein
MNFQHFLYFMSLKLCMSTEEVALLQTHNVMRMIRTDVKQDVLVWVETTAHSPAILLPEDKLEVKYFSCSGDDSIHYIATFVTDQTPDAPFQDRCWTVIIHDNVIFGSPNYKCKVTTILGPYDICYDTAANCKINIACPVEGTLLATGWYHTDASNSLICGTAVVTNNPAGGNPCSSTDFPNVMETCELSLKSFGGKGDKGTGRSTLMDAYYKTQGELMDGPQMGKASVGEILEPRHRQY